MILGLWGRMRKRREEKKKELERIQEEKRLAKEAMTDNAWKDFAAAREAHRQRMYQEDMAALKVSSLDARRDQMQGTLTARRAYLVDTSRNVEQSDANMIAAQQFIQSIQESTSPSSSSCDSGSSHTDTGSSSSSSSSDCGSSGSDSGGGSCGCD